MIIIAFGLANGFDSSRSILIYLIIFSTRKILNLGWLNGNGDLVWLPQHQKSILRGDCCCMRFEVWLEPGKLSWVVDVRLVEDWKWRVSRWYVS